MKKLNKLQINSDRLMNNDELIALRGGYDGDGGDGVGCGLVCNNNCSKTSGCPNCMEPIGWPGTKYCYSA